MTNMAIGKGQGLNSPYITALLAAYNQVVGNEVCGSISKPKDEGEESEFVLQIAPNIQYFTEEDLTKVFLNNKKKSIFLG